jgi:hypothetical protein
MPDRFELVADDDGMVHRVYKRDPEPRRWLCGAGFWIPGHEPAANASHCQLCTHIARLIILRRR